MVRCESCLAQGPHGNNPIHAEELWCGRVEGRPAPAAADHPFAGSRLFLGRDGQWAWALQSAGETLQVQTGVSRDAFEALEELIKDMGVRCLQLRSNHVVTDFRAGDRVKHHVLELFGVVDGFRLNAYVCVIWDNGERGDFYPQGLYKLDPAVWPEI